MRRQLRTLALVAGIGAASALGEKVLRKDLAGAFSLKDVYRPGWSGLSQRASAAAAVEILCDLAWLQAIDEPTAGRTHTRYHVNPRVWALPR